MKFILLHICFLICVQAYSQKQANLVNKIDGIINPYVRTNNYSGTVLISHGGKNILSRTYGKMSHEYNLDHNPDTKFLLASVSMIFTSAAILKLEENGKLKLTDPVSTYFPEYKHGSKLTLHTLLAQRSGIPAIGAAGTINYDSITKYEHSPEKLFTLFKDDDLVFEPGTRYNHGRSDYILLALLIEKLSGKSFGQYLKDEIFKPLAMNNSGHLFNEREIVPNLAKGYAPKDLYEIQAAAHLDWSSKTGHASIYSTTNDLLKFTEAIQQNKLLTRQSWDKILTNHGDNVGYGWFIRKHLNRDRFQMNGRSPGVSTYLGVYPKDRLTIIVLSNNEVSIADDIGLSLAAVVLNEPFEGLNLTKNPIPPSEANKFTGSYKFDKDFYRPEFELTIKYENGNLFSDWGGLLPIDKGSKNYREFILRSYWTDIRFIEDNNGKITHMTFDNHKGVKNK